MIGVSRITLLACVLLMAAAFMAMTDVVKTAEEVIQCELVGADSSTVRLKLLSDRVRELRVEDVREIVVTDAGKADWLALVLPASAAVVVRVEGHGDSLVAETAAGRVEYLHPEAGYPEMTAKCQELRKRLAEHGQQTPELRRLVHEASAELDELDRAARRKNEAPCLIAAPAGCLAGAVIGGVIGIVVFEPAGTTMPLLNLFGLGSSVLGGVIVGSASGCCLGAGTGWQIRGRQERITLDHHRERVNALVLQVNSLRMDSLPGDPEKP